MIFTCTQENLLAGLSSVVPVAGRNSQLPILQYILLQGKDNVLHLTSTDLEIGVHTIVGGKIEGDGVCAVPARRLLDYVQQLPKTNPIVLKLEEQHIIVSTKGFSAKFPLSDAEDFPLLPTIHEDTVIPLDGTVFCNALTSVLFAASREDARPEIRSVFVKIDKGELRVAATDSFRLAEKNITIASSEIWQSILPLASVQEIVRLFSDEKSIHILPHDSHISFRSDTVEFSSRLVDANYPDYQQIIPTTSETVLKVDKNDFLRALKTVSVFLPRDSKRVKLQFLPDKEILKVSVLGVEVGEGEVEVRALGDGDEFTVMLNIQYVMDGAAHISSKACVLCFGTEADPVVIKPDSERAHYVYVVMPIQV